MKRGLFLRGLLKSGEPGTFFLLKNKPGTFARRISPAPVWVPLPGAYSLRRPRFGFGGGRRASVYSTTSAIFSRSSSHSAFAWQVFLLPG